MLYKSCYNPAQWSRGAAMRIAGGGRKAAQSEIVIKGADPGSWQLLEDGVCVHMPEWAQFFLELGQEIACYEVRDRVPVVAVSLPARSYAAMFAAVGVVRSRARINTIADNEEYFEQLWALAGKGDRIPVEYREAGKRIQGYLTGRSQDGEVRRLHIDLGKEGVRKITPQIASRIVLKEKIGKQGRGKANRNPALSAVLDLPDLTDFLGRARLDCIIVAQKNEIRPESGLRIRPYQSANIEVEVNDILRVKEWLVDWGAYRTHIVSERLRDNGRVPQESLRHAPVVIFDGAKGFIQRRGEFTGLPWLILLDRTERGYRDAAQEVDALDSTRVGDAEKLRIPHIPQGVELVAFEVRR
ncbi:hypothetical protein Tter_2651 [Thermobaculum terrenum ATCC BAA-798]|uniref:Uncharacterized protein n=2 Tax=Thermobaculum TaxID=262406 RepID=D1CIG8_THET1|nr:hypothetical protein Tter_2651 [Thermobaculum terrenum ATCC BAA-798]